MIKAALRHYARSLPTETALEIFERCGLLAAVDGPTDLSETYKEQIDYSGKHGDDR